MPHFILAVTHRIESPKTQADPRSGLQVALWYYNMAASLQAGPHVYVNINAYIKTQQQQELTEKI